LRALELYDFDAVMFPLNWHMHMEHGMGERTRRVVKDRGLGLLGIKSMVDRAWSHEEQDSSKYIKSWCRPFESKQSHRISWQPLYTQSRSGQIS
jgi:hypothetical protein